MEAEVTHEDRAGPAAGRSRMQKVKHIAAEEFRRYVISFLYLYVLLGVFTIHEDIVLRERSLGLAPHGWALVNALVLGKVMLIAEDLRLGTRFKSSPLIYPIVIEAFILSVLFLAIHVLEHLIAGVIHGEALAASIPMIGGGGPKGVAFAGFSFFVALIPFCGFRQVSHAIGPERMRSLLLGPPPERR
jgi:hypothetical protein